MMGMMFPRCGRGSIILMLSAGCILMAEYSSSVSLPGLFSMLSGTPILPEVVKQARKPQLLDLFGRQVHASRR